MSSIVIQASCVMRYDEPGLVSRLSCCHVRRYHFLHFAVNYSMYMAEPCFTSHSIQYANLYGGILHHELDFGCETRYATVYILFSSITMSQVGATSNALP